MGNTEDKWVHFDSESFETLGVTVEAHGKIPDEVWNVGYMIVTYYKFDYIYELALSL